MPAYQETRRLIADAARHDRQYGELPDWSEEPWPDGLDILEMEEALRETERWIRAARHVQARVRAAMLTDVAANGAIRLGDMLYRDVPDRRRQLVDRDALVAFLGDDLARAVNVSEANVRITVVRGIAEARGLDPTAVEDTFFEWVDVDPDHPGRKLTATPISKAPKWAQALQEGERSQ